MNKRPRILVADRSAIYRRIFSLAALRAAAGAEIVPAENGGQVLELLTAGPVDVCLLDIGMAASDRLDILRRIREKYARLPVILVSDDSPDGARETLQALGLGAVDFIRRPQAEDFEASLAAVSRLLQELLAGILPAGQPEDPSREPAPGSRPARPWTPDVLLLAASTGGPAALEKVIPRLRADFPLPVLVVQHMPAGFTAMLAQNLNGKSALPVSEARENDEAAPGRVLIAPGGFHMTVCGGADGRRIVRLTKDSPVCGVRPAANVLFRTAAQAYAGKRVLAAVLTGMGHDGTDGVSWLKRQTDCRCLAQSENSCVVFGMPRSVQEAGLCDETWDIEKMAERIGQLAGRSTR